MARKLQERAQDFVRFLRLKLFLKKVAQLYKEALIKYEMRIKGQFMSVVFAHKWAARQKRFGPCIHQVNRRDLRKHITFLSLASNVVYVSQAKSLCAGFCQFVINNMNLNITFTWYFEQIVWM